MADEQPNRVNLSAHPLVARLHPDPDDSTSYVALVGYLGPSRREDSIRLYQDLSFRNYYEIPSDSIVATTPIDANDENSPTRVLVQPSARLEAVSTTSQSFEAQLLSGSIAAGHLSSAAPTAATAAAGCQHITFTFKCTCHWTGSVACSVEAANAAFTANTFFASCPGCPITVTCVVQTTHTLHFCPTNNPFICPSEIEPCYAPAANAPVAEARHTWLTPCPPCPTGPAQAVWTFGGPCGPGPVSLHPTCLPICGTGPAPAAEGIIFSHYPCPTVAMCPPSWNCPTPPLSHYPCPSVAICQQAAAPAAGGPILSHYLCPTAAICPPTWNCPPQQGAAPQATPVCATYVTSVPTYCSR